MMTKASLAFGVLAVLAAFFGSGCASDRVDWGELHLIYREQRIFRLDARSQAMGEALNLHRRQSFNHWQYRLVHMPAQRNSNITIMVLEENMVNSMQIKRANNVYTRYFRLVEKDDILPYIQYLETEDGPVLSEERLKPLNVEELHRHMRR